MRNASVRENLDSIGHGWSGVTTDHHLTIVDAQRMYDTRWALTVTLLGASFAAVRKR